jgi:hypothetical protein
VTSNGQIWLRGALGPGTGNAWSSFGVASNVTAMTVHNGELLVASNNALWKLGAFVPGGGNLWINYGEASNVTGMASFNGNLYVTSNNALWQRGALGPGTGNDWTNVGDAYSVTSMASFNGNLYVTSNGSLWQRGAIGPGTGSAWTNVGQASNVTAMASFNGNLYVASNNALWQRGAIGPGTGNDWTNVGVAYSVTAMVAISAGNDIPTLNAWPTSPLPDGAQVALQGSRRFNLGGTSEIGYAGVSSFGPAWLGLQSVYDPTFGMVPLLTADDAQLVPTDIFTLTVIPRSPNELLANNEPTNFQKILLRAANGNYVGMPDANGLLAANATSENDAQVFVYDLTIPQGSLRSVGLVYSSLSNGSWDNWGWVSGGPPTYGQCFGGPYSFQTASGSTNLTPYGWGLYNAVEDGCYFTLYVVQ